MEALEAWFLARREAILEELEAFVRIPSVSTDPAYKREVAKAADFVATKLVDAGILDAKVCPTEGHPVVVAWSAGQTDRAGLRPFRCSAAGPGRGLDNKTVRARNSRWSPLCARRLGRQGADADTYQGSRGFPDLRRGVACQHGVPLRRRRGNFQRAPRSLRCRQSRLSRRRLRAFG